MNIVVIIIGYLAGILGGMFLTRQVCKILDLPKSKDTGLLKAGQFIGYFERFLIITFILIKMYEPIGLLFVGKSIIRFSNREESEYFLVGTLTSFSWAVLIGVILSFLYK